jgi:hypothetical protein
MDIYLCCSFHLISSTSLYLPFFSLFCVHFFFLRLWWVKSMGLRNGNGGVDIRFFCLVHTVAVM